MPHPQTQPSRANAKIVFAEKLSAESGTVVVMHHNDNWSPRMRAARAWLIRAAVVATAFGIIALTLGWLVVLFHAVKVVAGSVAPALTATFFYFGEFLQWFLPHA